MDTPQANEPREQPISRAQLIRDAISFQIKLLADGLRDLILIPVSAIMAIVSFVTGGREFYDVVAMGHRADRWINLFGVLSRTDDSVAPPADGNLDAVIGRVEQVLGREIEQRNIDSSVREALKKTISTLDGIRDRAKRGSGADAENENG